MNHSELWRVVVLAFATAAISVTISKAGIFGFLRELVARVNGWLGRLVSCPYCTSHWVSFAFVAIYQPEPISDLPPVDMVVSAFAMVAIAAILIGIITRLIQFDSHHGLKDQNPNGID